MVRYYFLDNNIFNFAVMGAGGAVIHRVNESISRFPELKQDHTAFCMTPFSLLEALGTKLPEIQVAPNWKSGASAGEVVGDMVGRAKEAYLSLPELSFATIAQRVEERRSFVPVECRPLFDICVTSPSSRPEITTEIANMLAWDRALKTAAPKGREEELIRFYLTMLILGEAAPLTSRFRVVKMIWDLFYRNRKSHAPAASKELDAANRAMRLKSTRDFVDCDLLHLACFGWLGHEVVAFTCDPTESICRRISVYKGILHAALGQTVGVPEHKLAKLSDGRVAFCHADGEIESLARIQALPRIG